MKLSRRKLLHLAACAAALPAVPRIAYGQTYPSRPVRIIVPFAAAGPNDIIARALGQWLSEHLAQSFVIENRPGAASNIGTEVVVNAAPDGYTVLMVSSPHAINATLYEKLHFNFIRDIAPVAGIMRIPNVMVVAQAFPVRSVPEFISHAKANPGKLNFASSGVGASNHMSGELFKAMTGIEMTHVPYRSSGPALTDLFGGQVQVMFDAMTSTIEHIKANKLRPLAVTSAAQSALLPETLVMSDFVPGYEVSNWFGLGMPRNTPEEIVNVLNKAVNDALADPKLKARLADLGGTTIPGSPADFGKLIADETEKWGKVIRAANIKPE
ncbi:MAG TPA: tripartite tricarboxylate transporter substrate binding protein [Xanthobacteraceae bacterium]|nr:tripartite tricarboxylate transporter substrate binding protein [Xanthobacteraceae bacterium]